MRFYVLSDLHIGHNSNKEEAKKMLGELCSKIRASSFQEEILFIILGDLIDRGDTAAFCNARECLNYIKSELHDFNVKFEFVPGNHDAHGGDLSSFDDFIAEYGVTCSFTKTSVYSRDFGGVNFIFADSNLERLHNAPGKIDVESIKTHIRPKQNVIFCHHGFTHNHGASHDVILDGAKILDQLEEMSISFAFHGHVHRADVTIKENGITEIGCGTLLQNVTDMRVLNQFLVGFIRDEKVVAVHRCSFTADGSDGLLSGVLFPKKEGFVDADKISKISYPSVEDYIIRKVVPHEVALKSGYTWFLEKEQITLTDASLKTRTILLLSDAGLGKSIEMHNLAYQLSNIGFYPYLYYLSEYTGGAIETLFPEQYRGLTPERKVLILDGYDEISSAFNEHFEKELSKYVRENPLVRIIVSSRSNFCRSENTNESRTFKNFWVFDLCRLSGDDVKEYLQRHSVAEANFWEVCDPSIYELLYIPFYLTRIIKIFKKDGVLPKKSLLMEKFIDDSFNNDADRFPKEIEDSRYNIFAALQKVSFAMQLMQKNFLDHNDEYQVILSTDEMRLAKYSSLLYKVGNGWKFVHNNFREYLAAKYLSQLSQDEVISYISAGYGIKPSWVNTLGFLTGLKLKWNLLDWIAQHAPNALVKFEKENIDPITRFEVFKCIFEKYEEKDIRINDDLCDERELAEFADDIQALSFLMDRINSPKNNASLHNAVIIIRYFKNLYGKQNEVRECLLSCCARFPEIAEYTCDIAIYAISALNLNNPSVTQRLLDLFKQSENDYVRYGMYEYLKKTGEHNEYAWYFIDGIKYIKHCIGDKDVRIMNEAHALADGLKMMSTHESISKVFEWYIGAKNEDFYESEKVLVAVCKNAVDVYKSGETKILDNVLACCVHALERIDNHMVHAAADFFEATGTLKTALISLIDRESERSYFLGDLLYYKKDSIDIIIAAYKEGTLGDYDALKKIAYRYADDSKFIACSELIKEKTGEELYSRDPIPNYAQLRKEAEQKFFDMLFDRSEAESLLNKLLIEFGKEELLISEMLDGERDFDSQSILGLFASAIYRYGNRNKKTKDFLKDINWERFVLCKAGSLIKHQNVLVISEKQKSALKEMIDRAIANGVFEKEVKADGKEASLLVQAILSLIVHFDFDLGKKSTLKMVSIHSVWFPREKESCKYDYLERHATVDSIKQSIEEHMSSCGVSEDLFLDYLIFCQKHRFDSCVDRALSICRHTDETSIARHESLEYLYALYGAEYICVQILPDAGESILLEVAYICKDISRHELRCAMERVYSKNKSLRLQAHLISMQSDTALKDYLEYVKKEKKPPDYGCAYGDSSTQALAAVKDIRHLPLLGDLIDCVYDKGFIDNEYHGLRSSLNKALIECGKIHPEETIETIETHIQSMQGANKDVRYCNYIIDEIERQRRRIEDTALDITEVKHILG